MKIREIRKFIEVRKACKCRKLQTVVAAAYHGGSTKSLQATNSYCHPVLYLVTS